MTPLWFRKKSENTRMRLNRTIRNLLTLALLACPVAAFTQEAASSTTASARPSPFGEKRGKKSMFGEAIGGHWTLSGELGTTSSYSSNKLSSGPGLQDDIVESFSGRFSASIFTKKYRFEAHYTPEYSFHHELSSQDALSHSYSHDLSVLLTKRLDMVWTLDARQFSNNQLLGVSYAGVPGFDLAGANLQAVEQNQDVINSGTAVTFNYNQSPANKYTLRLSSGMSHFSGSNVGIGAISEISYNHGGSLGWTRQIDSGRKSIGFEGSETYFGFIGPNRHQHYETAKLRYVQKLPWRLTASVGAGPGFKQSQPLGLTPADEEIEWALDASLDRAGEVWNTSISYNHGAQQALIQQSITTDQLAARVQRSFGKQKKWSSTVNCGFTRSVRELASGYLDGMTSGGDISYRWTHFLQFHANYTFVHQHAQINITPLDQINRHVASVGIRYTFGPFQPSLGR
jgi:opacity protein-like surface antigen